MPLNTNNQVTMKGMSQNTYKKRSHTKQDFIYYCKEYKTLQKTFVLYKKNTIADLGAVFFHRQFQRDDCEHLSNK